MAKALGRSLVVAILLALVLVACQTSTPASTPTNVIPTSAATDAAPTMAPTATPLVLEGATITDSGLQYLELTAGDGRTPEVGDIVTLEYVATLPDGTELGNSYADKQPMTTILGHGNLLPGWEEGIGLMKVNGKARLVLPPELAFGAMSANGIPPNSQIVIELELLDARPTPVPTMVNADQLTKTASGLEYYDLVVGSGAESIAKGSVTTHYTLWVKTDTGYDYIVSSQGGTPFNFVLGRGDMVFPGWDEGATGMRVGGKRLLVIPPQLGMGEQGLGAIPPSAILVMEIELIEVSEPHLPVVVDEKDFTTTDSGLKYYDLVPGTGAVPAVGKPVTVHYTGWLEDGTQFDSSIERGEPFQFTLGIGQVILGWDEGVATMRVGGKRQLIIPSDLGYGDQGAGALVPSGATLIFEVELLDAQP